jgi:capsular polysaccharide transport system permease protein
LQQQLGEELIKLDLLSEQANESDPRAVQSKLRIEAIRKRIAEERRKLGGGADMQGDGGDYASIVTEFEKLTVDREFAEQKYTTALSNFDTAQAEARRQTRYLAAFEQPTLPESAEYPRRWLILGLTVLFLTVGWSILVLIYYSLRDRR